jgi:hypothetical protein
MMIPTLPRLLAYLHTLHLTWIRVPSLPENISAIGQIPVGKPRLRHAAAATATGRERLTCDGGVLCSCSRV